MGVSAAESTPRHRRLFGYRVRQISTLMPRINEMDNQNVINRISEDRSPVNQATQIGPIIPYLAPVLPDTHCASNYNYALRHRICSATPPLLNRYVRKIREEARVQSLAFNPLVSVYTVRQWLEVTTYPKHRKDELMKIAQVISGVDDPTYEQYLSRFNIDKYTSCKSFIKNEIYGKFKFPRTINSRLDPFKIAMGPFVHAVSDEVYKSTYMIKNIPIRDVMKHVSKVLGPCSRYGCSDYSSFEASIKPEMYFNTEYQLYKRMSKRLPMCAKIMYLCGILGKKNHLQSKLGSADVFGRMSGEMSTSLGNTFINHVLLCCMAREVGLSSTFRCVCEGDDSVYTDPEQRITPQIAALYGVKMTQENHSRLSECGFCQMYCDVENHDYEVVRDFYPILLKFGWSLSRLRNSLTAQKGLLRAKVLSLCCELPGCPVIRSFASSLLKCTRGVRAIYEDPDEWWIRNIMMDDYGTSELPEEVSLRMSKPIPLSRRQLYDRLFHISPDQQIELECYFRNINANSPLDHPLLSSRLGSHLDSMWMWRIYQEN